MEQCKAHALTAVAIAGFVVSSCSSSGRPAIYVLDDAAPGQPGVTEVLGKPVVGLQHVQLPDYLDTTDIMTHRAGGRIHASTTGQWGDRLSTGVTRTLAESLGTQLPEVSVRGLPSTERPWLGLRSISASSKHKRMAAASFPGGGLSSGEMAPSWMSTNFSSRPRSRAMMMRALWPRWGRISTSLPPRLQQQCDVWNQSTRCCTAGIPEGRVLSIGPVWFNTGRHSDPTSDRDIRRNQFLQ
jgi:ABC-type transport auxiliary lipoprotein component